MKFYDEVIHFSADGVAKCVDFVEREIGRWATRDDAEQLEKERDLYKFEAEKLTKVIDALVKPEQAAKDAVWAARRVQAITINQLCERYPHKGTPEIIELAKSNIEYVEAQAIIERYEGGKG